MDEITRTGNAGGNSPMTGGSSRFWEEPGMHLRLAGPAALAAALVAAMVPNAPPGLNLFLSALGIGSTLILARPAPRSPQTLLLAGLAILLSVTPVIRAAGWIIALNLIFAAVLACWAVAGAKTWTELAQGLAGPVGRLPQVPVVLVRLLEGGRRDGGREVASSVLRGALLAGVLLFAFGMLFASADAAFAQLARNLLPGINLDKWTVVRIALYVITFTGTVALGLAGPRFGVPAINSLIDYVVEAVAPVVEGRRRLVRTLKPVEWIPALGLLVLLFLLFVGVQVTVLFGGHDHVLSTSGLTYAEYARQGFGQLLAVSALFLGLLAAANLAFGRPTHRDSRLFNVLFGSLGLLSLVVLASALHRLTLYEAAFGFTRLRLSAHAAIFWLGWISLLVAALWAGGKLAHLPLASVTSTAVGLMIFTLWNPDGQIAEKNVERFRDQQKLDATYLSTLSPDAVPALLSLPERTGGPIVRAIAGRLNQHEPPTSWNLSRSRAREAAGPLRF